MASKNKIDPLFVTEKVKGRILYRLFVTSVFVAIILVWVYRISHIPSYYYYEDEEEKWRIWVWIGMMLAEFWFGFYWFLTQSVRWNRVHRRTFPDRLSQRYGEKLPKVDIFVCTADPAIEPPVMVINTVLSVMAYDYPSENLSVYLSDDAGSEITFYGLLEASGFSKYWLPYCKKFKVEPRSPAAYFELQTEISDANHAKEYASVKKLYQEMENRIEVAYKLGRVLDREQHKGFAKWDSSVSRGNHDTILQILINGRSPDARDITGCTLPTLVYLAREKRPQHFHNFKAGAMNALIRVSSGISNAPVILNVDCDMYSNNSRSIQEALCFLMDEKNGHEIAYVQFPQMYQNMTKNDLYGSCMTVVSEVEFPGLDGNGGPLYIGSGCFHRREVLCGRKFKKEDRIELKNNNDSDTRNVPVELEEKLKDLASCTYEENTKWGNEMGLKYNCPVEDVITGLSIQCQGWKSVYCKPRRAGFMGIAATTLDQILVQQKRWSEGDFQILLSKYSPAWYGLGKISPSLTMGYCIYCFWCVNCLATLYYSIIPSLYLLNGISLFPESTKNLWFLPFCYVILSVNIYSVAEFLWSGGTIQGWWNDQRMWLYKRTTSYLFAFIDTILKLMGFSESKFVISSKLFDENVSKRYNEEIMEFGTDSTMITILSSLAMINLICFFWALICRMNLERMFFQILCCGILVLINLPLYNAILFRKDEGRIPSSVTVKAVFLAVFACIFSMALC